MKQFEYTIKAMSKLYASWAFFPRSTFSTAFQSVSWSAYSGGAWAGSRIAYDISRHPDFKQTMDILINPAFPFLLGFAQFLDSRWAIFALPLFIHPLYLHIQCASR